jgi:hypothetical protein
MYNVSTSYDVITLYADTLNLLHSLYCVYLCMDYNLYLKIAGTQIIPDGMQQEVFDAHNSLIGESKFVYKKEDRHTYCSSCKARVMSNLWKHYHYEYQEKFDSLEFTGNLGINQMPLYRMK